MTPVNNWEAPVSKAKSLPSLVAFFSGLGTRSGGIGMAASLAWDALSSAYVGGIDMLSGVCYGALEVAGDAESYRPTQVRSKAHAVLATLRLRGKGRLLLFWHVGLLKLLPFVKTRRSTTVLALMGIEAWRPPGRFTDRLLGKVELFLAISDHTWSRFCQVNPRLSGKPHRTVYLGLGSPVENPMQPEPTPTTVMISRLARSEDYKGHREVILAWPSVLKRLPEARLWIVGDGDLRADLERLVAQEGLESHAQFWGWVQEDEKERLITRARCLALPSRGEGFGLVYLEAMRLGRPCLVSTLDAGREVVNPPEAGIAVDPSNPEMLADGLCELMTPGKKWDQWSRQAKQRYDNHFTAEHFQRRLLHALGLE
jgi:phosphatidylinositol alpha-1,6-mannosyltransferase